MYKNSVSLKHVNKSFERSCLKKYISKRRSQRKNKLMVYDNEGMMNDAKRKESRIYDQEWKIDE